MGKELAGGAAPEQRLLSDVRMLIEAAKDGLSRTANSTLVALYWGIGTRIREDVLQRKRADYGRRIVSTLSRQLHAQYGTAYSEKSLRHMVRFAESFPDRGIVSTLWRQLGWSHFRELFYIEDPVKRDFYAEMCRVERWSVRTLRAKVAGMLYERTALSRKPAKLAAQEVAALRAEDRMTPDMVFQDPYLLGFLGLKDAYREKDLEAAILRKMEEFLLELGAGFAFIARQKRIEVDGRDYYLDLLFYNRHLKRLVAVELKLDRFQPEHKGQMELYMKWLDKHERAPGEEPPTGVILCSGKGREEVELLELDRSGIRVAEYITGLPSRAELEKKLRQALESARRTAR
jgi:predicted nuclease of restriction endonuclease-like (RecB) superfamily